jgi:Na+-driven multidrug efflux pump
MISLVRKILAIDIFLEAGRVTNLVYGNALKTAGDAIFPAVIAAIFMFLCAVGGTYLFGIRLEWMVIGAYVGLALDECVRAVGMWLRWKSGKWREMSLVSK